MSLEERRAKDRENYQRNRTIIAARSKAKRLIDLEATRSREKIKNIAYRPIANAKNRTRARADPEYRIVRALRGRLAAALRVTGQRKAAKSAELLGCSPPELRRHIEAQFADRMNWSNYGHGLGEWHIDHIRPVCTFDLTDPAQQRICFHYTNLRPLWATDNLARPRKNWRPESERERIAA